MNYLQKKDSPIPFIQKYKGNVFKEISSHYLLYLGHLLTFSYQRMVCFYFLQISIHFL